MKKLLTIIIALITMHALFAQHYGGIYLSPDLTFSGRSGNYYSENNHFTMTPGYSFGYQGLTMENRRFSLAYGLNYSYKFLEDIGSSDLLLRYDHTNQAVGIRTTYHAFELPISLRFNLLKGKKFQPYISAGVTMVIPLKTNYGMIDSGGAITQIPYNRPDDFHMYFDLGIGASYKVKDYIFNVQPTIRPWERGGKFGIGISVLKKF